MSDEAAFLGNIMAQGFFNEMEEKIEGMSRTKYIELYKEKVLQRDDVIDAEFEVGDEWPK